MCNDRGDGRCEENSHNPVWCGAYRALVTKPTFLSQIIPPRPHIPGCIPATSPCDDSSKTAPSACHPLPPNFTWLTPQLKCSLISLISSLTSCVMFFCYIPAAPAFPAFQNLLPAWWLPGTHLSPSACLGARPGSNQVCLAPLHCLTSTRHGAWHMPHHLSIPSVLAGLN